MTAQRDWRLFGRSVCGPAHIRAGLPNQDAWRGARLARGAAIVVADGLGSRPHSHRGSRVATRAVVDALSEWSRVEGAPVVWLLRLVHNLWGLGVHPLSERDCATTCLFAFAGADGRLTVARLGDGVAIVEQDGAARKVGPNKDGFINETTGLGLASSLSEWAVEEIAPGAGLVSVTLATDGVSEDLLPDGLAAFPVYLRETYGDMLPASRRRRLGEDLRNWPVAGHSDDKSVAFLWSDPPEEET